jgi:hypothetical protein
MEQSMKTVTNVAGLKCYQCARLQTRKAALIEKKRATGYSIGTLQQARDAFQDATKLTIEWEADEP